MSLPKEIKSNVWVKNWSGNWRTAFASLYRLYTTNLKQYIGKNLNLNLLICEENSSSNSIAKIDLDSGVANVLGRAFTSDYHDNMAKTLLLRDFAVFYLNRLLDMTQK